MIDSLFKEHFKKQNTPHLLKMGVFSNNQPYLIDHNNKS